jgi:hypothetical protein
MKRRLSGHMGWVPSDVSNDPGDFLGHVSHTVFETHPSKVSKLDHRQERLHKAADLLDSLFRLLLPRLEIAILL